MCNKHKCLQKKITNGYQHVKFLTLTRILKYPYALIIFRSNFFNVSLILLEWLHFSKMDRAVLPPPLVLLEPGHSHRGVEYIFLPLETTWDFETVSTK